MIPKIDDTVRLVANVTMAEFGLALCDVDGVGLDIDGVVGKVEHHMANVVIRRMMPALHRLPAGRRCESLSKAS